MYVPHCMCAHTLIIGTEKHNTEGKLLQLQSLNGPILFQFIHLRCRVFMILCWNPCQKHLFDGDWHVLCRPQMKMNPYVYVYKYKPLHFLPHTVSILFFVFVSGLIYSKIQISFRSFIDSNQTANKYAKKELLFQQSTFRNSCSLCPYVII